MEHVSLERPRERSSGSDGFPARWWSRKGDVALKAGSTCPIINPLRPTVIYRRQARKKKDQSYQLRTGRVYKVKLFDNSVRYYGILKCYVSNVNSCIDYNLSKR
jgi:hypothetical protein